MIPCSQLEHGYVDANTSSTYFRFVNLLRQSQSNKGGASSESRNLLRWNVQRTSEADEQPTGSRQSTRMTSPSTGAGRLKPTRSPASHSSASSRSIQNGEMSTARSISRAKRTCFAFIPSANGARMPPGTLFSWVIRAGEDARYRNVRYRATGGVEWPVSKKWLRFAGLLLMGDGRGSANLPPQELRGTIVAGSAPSLFAILLDQITSGGPSHRASGGRPGGRMRVKHPRLAGAFDRSLVRVHPTHGSTKETSHVQEGDFPCPSCRGVNSWRLRGSPRGGRGAGEPEGRRGWRPQLHEQRARPAPGRRRSCRPSSSSWRSRRGRSTTVAKPERPRSSSFRSPRGSPGFR